MDRPDAGTLSGDVTARTFPDRALSLRCDRCSFERSRLADVCELRPRGQTDGRVHPHGGFQQDKQRPEQLRGWSRRYHDTSSIPVSAVSRRQSDSDDVGGSAGNLAHRGIRPVRRPAERRPGGGAYTTTLALYSQTYFWLPNGRILRMRFNVSQSVSNNPSVEDVSVYGTQAGFRGHAKPGDSFYIDLSWEYSLTRRWVLALDATYRHNWNSRVIGYNALKGSPQNLPIIQMDSGSSEVLGFAPAIEHSWTPNLGVLLGMRVIPPSHNTNPTITPAVAINFVH